MAPAETAEFIASCIIDGQSPSPARLMFITLAAFPFRGRPETGSPAAQRMASAMSVATPPPLPRTLTGSILLFQSIPATPDELFVLAPIVPVT